MICIVDISDLKEAGYRTVVTRMQGGPFRRPDEFGIEREIEFGVCREGDEQYSSLKGSLTIPYSIRGQSSFNTASIGKCVIDPQHGQLIFVKINKSGVVTLLDQKSIDTGKGSFDEGQKIAERAIESLKK